MLHSLVKRSLATPIRRLVGVLALSSVAGIALLAFRASYAGRMGYWSLPWDLFLAWIPVPLALVVARLSEQERKPWMAMLSLAFLWLLFFPNAPYLVTQFMHLHPSHAVHNGFHRFAAWTPRGNVPIWFDVLMLSTYAWTGLMLGFVSLHLIHRAATRVAGSAVGWFMAIGAVALSAFGVSLGRFERWNSWDLFARPMSLMGDVLDRMLNPFAHPRTTAVTLGFAAFLLLGYLTLVALIRLGASDGGGSDRGRGAVSGRSTAPAR
jgi:uncharacterized membrane protein